MILHVRNLGNGAGELYIYTGHKNVFPKGRQHCFLSMCINIIWF